MKSSTATSDGLEWLRAIREQIQAEIGTAPGARAAHYQAREKRLAHRLYRRRIAETPPSEHGSLVEAS
jgi:hypothetical protein